VWYGLTVSADCGSMNRAIRLHCPCLLRDGGGDEQ
jgi:hypothetical protein